MFYNILGNTVAAPNRSPAPDESVADTTAAITKPAIIGHEVASTVATALFPGCLETQLMLRGLTYMAGTEGQ